VYQTELIYHGTPSGIDNTVVAFEKPVYFIKDVSCEIFGWAGLSCWPSPTPHREPDQGGGG